MILDYYLVDPLLYNQEISSNVALEIKQYIQWLDRQVRYTRFTERVE